MFDEPGTPGAGVEWKELLGALLIIDVHAVKTGIQTTYGLSDAVQATVTIADGPQAGTVHPDTLIFPRVLQSQLSGKIGAKILGRLGQGVAKPGQDPPWMLNPATDADKAQAGAVLTHLASSGLQGAAPAVAPQVPVQQPVVGPQGQQQAYVPPAGQPVPQYVPQPQGPAPTY